MTLFLTLKKNSLKPISSHAMLALNNLILKSRKSFGTYKASDILENKSHAFDFLLQAITSDSTALRLLAKDVNQALNVAPNLMNAINSYMDQICHHHKSEEFVIHSQYFLKLFAKHLYLNASHSALYREASSAFLSSIDKKDHTFCINLIRSFFAHWENANQEPSETNLLNSAKISDHTKELTRLWNDIDTAFITTIEESLLSHYQHAIKKLKLLDDELKLRVKIAKVIMIHQRKYNKTAAGYRANIADVQSVFSNKDLLSYFLSVSREFYHSWENTIIKKSESSKTID
jgi:hypothetical protein